MRKKLFTPGPWRHAPQFNFKVRGHAIDAVDPQDGMLFMLCDVWGIDSKQTIGPMSEANAILIATSPRMLEALENIQTQIQQVNDGDRPYTGFDTELIDAVIAEAYGEQP